MMADDNANSAPIATETPTEVTKPDYVQDKFWNAETKEVNLENLASSYNALESKLGSRTEDLTKQIRTDLENERLSKVPESYQLNVPQLDESVNVEINNEMPIVQWWNQTAKDAGLSQEQYDSGVKAFIDNAVANLPNPELEIQKLGDTGKQRIEAAELWSKKHLSPDAFNAIAGFAATAEGVKAIEEIMKLSKDASMPNTTTQVDVSADMDDLKSMLNDPRYYDPARREPGYVKRVSELFEKAYNAKKD